MVAPKDDGQRQATEEIYHELIGSGIDVLLDDRDERPGVKFKDADLLGIPIKVVVGKGLAEGNVEVSQRHDSGSKEIVPIASAIAHVTGLVRALKAEVSV